ncbi:hypothetical protein FAI41_04640 [Acetobacteraceae bacterium]|nr:hypothetical protein FAI41_04640 [Acetobacteraceae bacterium]
MKWFYKPLLFLTVFPFLGGCEYAVQTWVFTPDVRRASESQCYQTKGIKLVPWANRLDSEKKLKPLFKTKHLTPAQKKELIYSRITTEEMEDQDPLNPRHSGLITIGLQNPFSIPVTSVIASTELPSLKKEYRACMWKLTLESATHNIAQQETIPLEDLHITAMEGEEEVLAKQPKESGIFVSQNFEKKEP